MTMENCILFVESPNKRDVRLGRLRLKLDTMLSFSFTETKPWHKQIVLTPLDFPFLKYVGLSFTYVHTFF